MMKHFIFSFLFSGLILLNLFSLSADDLGENTPNRFTGSDSERIAAAIAEAPKFGGLVKIPARLPDAESSRNYWLIDSAILVPGETTLLFENCKIKLSDQARDNFIRTANVMPEYKKIEPITDVHIIGIGNVVFEGADHPRSTGDSGKKLCNTLKNQKVEGVTSFGTDAGKEGEWQNGDWRNLGILLVKTDRFTLNNITIRQSHAWAVMLERCSNGHIADLKMFSQENKTIDGVLVKTRNLDGLDIQKGCHHITAENISGETGDDLVAISAIGSKQKEACGFEHFNVSESDEDSDNDIHHIILRNVMGHSNGGHHIIRILNTPQTKIHHILIDGLMDTSPDGITDKAALLIGDNGYGGPAPVENTYNLQIRNVQSKSAAAVRIVEPIGKSFIDSVINENPEGRAVEIQCDPGSLKTLTIQNAADP